MPQLKDEDISKIKALKDAGVPLVISYQLGKDSSALKSVVCAALPARSKVPRVLWTAVWSSNLYMHHLQQATEGTLRKTFGIPIKRVKQRTLVSAFADGTCRFAKASADLLLTGKYNPHRLPCSPVFCRQYPRVLMMDESWAKKIDAMVNPKPKRKRKPKTEEETNG